MVREATDKVIKTTDVINTEHNILHTVAYKNYLEFAEAFAEERNMLWTDKEILPNETLNTNTGAFFTSYVGMGAQRER